MPIWPKRKPRPGVDEYGRAPLWYRALEGDAAGVKSEIAAGADPSASDDRDTRHSTLQFRSGVQALLVCSFKLGLTRIEPKAWERTFVDRRLLGVPT